MPRHDMLILTEKGQERALLEAGMDRDCLLMERRREYEKKTGKALCIPAIVRRQERVKGGGLETGFAFPWFRNGQRIRLSGHVFFHEIMKMLSPFDVMRTLSDCKQGRMGDFFGELLYMSQRYGVSVGVYGSAALELVSGLPYLHKNSDVDLIIKASSVERTRQFYCEISKLAQQLGVEIDMEIRVGQLGDVKAQELFSQQNTLLIRGEREIFLYSRKKTENTINGLTSQKR